METKKVITYAILSLFILSLVGIASAETIEIDASSYSIWDNFIHSLQGLGLFTAAGQSRDCSSSADYTISGVTGYVSTSSLLGSANCDVALFNVFNKDWKFLGEYRSEDINGFQIAESSTVVDYPAIIEVYKCPYEACNSDADCSSPPASDAGDYCNIAYGACYGETPDYVTDLYKCISEQWMKYGTASFGEEHYCNEGLNNYIDREGAEHCVLPTYLSVNDGTWCGVEECSIGEIKCEGQNYYICSNGDWLNNGLVDGKCGYVDDIIIPLPDDAILSGVITDIQLFKNTFKPGEEVDVRFRVKNTGDEGYYLIETGIIPKSVATNWGFVSDTGLFSFFHPTTSTECCENQPNIFAKTIYFGNEEIHEIQIDIPKAPYDGITDLCYDNNYWDGEGEYVLYVIMKTGCYPEGKEVTYETIGININDTFIIPPFPTTSVISMTWTEFYSMSDDTFTKKAKGLGCNFATDCPTKEGYTIICEDNEQFSERLYEVSVASCDDNLGIIDELLTIATLGLGSGSYCEGVVKNWDGVTSFLEWIGIKAESPKGYCIAESTTWYGSAWEGTLKMMGGMGLPIQYVMIITVMLLITLVGFAMRMVMK